MHDFMIKMNKFHQTILSWGRHFAFLPANLRTKLVGLISLLLALTFVTIFAVLAHMAATQTSLAHRPFELSPKSLVTPIMPPAANIEQLQREQSTQKP